MKIRYYIDPETGLPHIYEHDVTEAEVEDILDEPGEDRHGDENSRVAVGQTQEGRHIRVIYVPDSDPNSFFIVTAYELTGKPLKAYKRRRNEFPIIRRQPALCLA